MVGGFLQVITLASSTTKAGHHDIAEILLKVALQVQCPLFCNLQSWS
jgi:hypothetical protein